MPKHKAPRKKRPGARGSGQAKSNLDGPATNSKLWNTTSQTWPMFNNTLKKDNTVHRFIQTTDLGTVVSSSTTLPVFYARAFTFTDVQQYASFAVIFDQYRIAEIEVWFNPGNISSSYNTGTSGYIYTATDYDDDTAWTQTSQAQQYTNVMMGPPNLGHYRRWKPHVAEALYSGAFTSYGNITAPWIDMGSTGVKHYAFKAALGTASSSNTAYSCSLTARIHFECRNVF
jgi:hypothetical protein